MAAAAADTHKHREKNCNKSYINIEIERKEIVSISFRKIGSDIWTGRKITNDIIIAADDDDDDDDLS